MSFVALVFLSLSAGLARMPAERLDVFSLIFILTQQCCVACLVAGGPFPGYHFPAIYSLRVLIPTLALSLFSDSVDTVIRRGS